MYDFTTLSTIQLLYLIEVADWDSQERLGYGLCSYRATPENTGLTDVIDWHSGCVAYSEWSAVKYRHMENLWGNVHQFVDGINFVNNQVYICTDPALYGPYKTTPDYTRLGFDSSSVNDGIWITDYGFDKNFKYALVATDGTDDGSGYPAVDGYVKNNQHGSYKVLIVGGSSEGNQTASGLFYFNIECPYEGYSRYFGSRSIYLPPAV